MDGGGGYSSGYGSSSSYSSSSRDSEPENAGSLRIRVNPAHAKVYLDGALIGTVDEFDGLSSHLAAEAGTHQLELRADGYEPFTTTVKVEAGQDDHGAGVAEKEEARSGRRSFQVRQDDPVEFELAELHDVAGLAGEDLGVTSL